MNRHLFVSIVTLLSASALQAQTIECKKQGAASAADVQSGTAAVRFVSTQGDWVITPETNDKAQPVTRKGNKYIYDFSTQLTANRESSFQMGRKGSAITERCVAKGLRSGFRTTFELEEIADTLRRIEVQHDDSPGGYFVEGKAYVEFSTSIKDLNIESAWPKTEKASATGARIVSFVIDVAQLDKMSADLANAQKELEALGDDYLNPKMDELDNKIQSLQEQLDRYAVIYLGGNGIKGVDIQLAGIKAKEKRRYPVIALTDSYDGLIQQAKDMWDQRSQHTDPAFYAKICEIYEKAISHKDAPKDKLDDLKFELDMVKSIRKDLFMAERFSQEIERAKAQYGKDSEQVYKFLGGRYRALSMVNDRFPEVEGVDKMRAEVLEQMNSHPLGSNAEQVTITRHRQHITGRAVKGENFIRDLHGIGIFAVDSPKEVKSSTKRMRLGAVKADGTFDFYLPKPVEYIYFDGETYPRSITKETSDMGTITLECK